MAQRVKLLCDLGADASGSVIDVDEATAKRLLAQGRAEDAADSDLSAIDRDVGAPPVGAEAPDDDADEDTEEAADEDGDDDDDDDER